MRKNLFATTPGIIIVGAVIGLIAVWLQKLGNPANMGICVACFERDVAGGLGLHRAAIVQYLRPEIMGLVLGSLAAAIATREFKPRGGSAPIVRFVLGMIAAMGALVFLGCPWRAILRLAGGDGNAILGLAGLATGIWFGTLFFKKGYSLGRSNSQSVVSGALFPVIAVCLLLLYLIFPQIPDQPQSGPLFYSVKGPGSQHAPFIAGAGLHNRHLRAAQPFLHDGRVPRPLPLPLHPPVPRAGGHVRRRIHCERPDGRPQVRL